LLLALSSVACSNDDKDGQGNATGTTTGSMPGGGGAGNGTWVGGTWVGGTLVGATWVPNQTTVGVGSSNAIGVGGANGAGVGGVNNVGAGGNGSTQTAGTNVAAGGTIAVATATVPPDAQPTPETSGVPGKYRVNSSGRVTEDGVAFQLRGGNWFGLEGQDDLQRPGAMELYIGSVSWANESDKRTIAKTMQEITAAPLKFNTIRLPVAPQTLVANHEDGRYSRTDVKIRNNDPAIYAYTDALSALKDFIVQADKNNLKVVLDLHSCSNHIGWRAGRVNDAPPWTDAKRENYKYKKENYTCRGGVDDYTVEKWLADIRTLAKLPKDLGVDNIIGIDCFNEPFKYTWGQWADLAKQCYDAIAEVNDDLIAFVEGVGSNSEDMSNVQTPEPYGSPETNPNWGENLYGQAFDPIQIPKDRLCFAPHTYGPSVYVQRQFVDQTQAGCANLEDDAAGKAKCKLVVERSNAATVALLRKGWDEHFGYLVKQGYCVMMGEWGGYKTWPQNPVKPSAATTWAHLPKNVLYDFEWQNILADYMKEIGLVNYTYWSINPESGDTGGLYNHAYSSSNESGWGVWKGLDADKVKMISAVQ
jgi:hypothetical protein